MSNRFTAILSVLAIIGCATVAEALTINPTYSGGSWTADRINVMDYAISQWESAIDVNQTVNVTMQLDPNLGALGTWSAGFSVPTGTDLYPWTPGVSHTITLRSTLWFDPDPTTPSTVPFSEWDALTVALHEIGHMLGFTAGFYFDNVGPNEQDKWTAHIVNGVFDPNGLNVTMAAPNNLGHTANSGSTAGDLMNAGLPNGVRREISQINLDMLALAYGYDVIPEPATVAVLMGGGAMVLLRRRRAA